MYGCLIRGDATCRFSGSAPPASFCDWMFEIGSPTAKNEPSGFLIPLALFTSKTVPAPMPVALIAANRMFEFV